MQVVKDTRHLYEVERREYYAQRPGFRIAEMQIGPTQTIPWHLHNQVQVVDRRLAGDVRCFLNGEKRTFISPHELVRLRF